MTDLIYTKIKCDVVDQWRPTAATLREAVLGDRIGTLDWCGMAKPELVTPHMLAVQPSPGEISRVSAMSKDAVQAGRLIDFGYIPNVVMAWAAARGGPLWQQGAIGMPFREPWMMLHGWDGGTGIYLVNPTDDGMEVAELQPLTADHIKFLSLSDRGLFKSAQLEGGGPRYNAVVLPSPLRFIGKQDVRDMVNGNLLNLTEPAQAACGNIGDPVTTGILILGTRMVPRHTVTAPDKLNRARVKSGKFPIPPYDVVDSRDYVTAIMHRAKHAKGEPLGGHHKSPVAHIRMGHPREYATGRSIWIADTLVNVPPEQRTAFKSRRSHYSVKD
jgi:hypothetical protein